MYLPLALQLSNAELSSIITIPLKLPIGTKWSAVGVEVPELDVGTESEKLMAELYKISKLIVFNILYMLFSKILLGC